MTVTSMPIVTILQGLTHAPASQRISETENTAHVSVSFTLVIFAMMELINKRTLLSWLFNLGITFVILG